LAVTPWLSIPDDEIEERFARASGPGGQNVNKVETAVQLRFDLRGSRMLTGEVKARLERLAGRRLTRDGVLVLTADRFRQQERNRADARERLAALIRAALERPRPRTATRPTKASRARRLETKTRRGQVKALRGRPRDEG